MKMSKQHFQFIAHVISTLPKPCRVYAAQAFSLDLAQTNNDFRRDKFMEACKTFEPVWRKRNATKTASKPHD